MTVDYQHVDYQYCERLETLKLSKWLISNGLCIAELAKYLNISRSQLSNLLANRRTPNKDLIEKVEKLTKGEVTKKDFGYFGTCPVCKQDLPNYNRHLS